MPITKTKISYELDIAEKVKKVKPGKRKQVAEQIGFAVIDEIVQHLQSGKSPVSKGNYKKTLSPEYAKKVGKRISDLDLTGDMLGNLSFDAFKDRVVFKITDGTQKKKAFNHNTGDTLPQRQFLPNDDAGEKFKRAIDGVINRIIDDASEDNQEN